jgi:hypothetical protein
MLIYSHVNYAFSPIYALSHTHLRGFNNSFLNRKSAYLLFILLVTSLITIRVTFYECY